ncbi:Choline-sulfatase (EC [Lentimonas sp. CC19]|nr:Choline-sulfatase (EC [Lentimonas sp. CC10]CAA6697046.1 Choline-sulfatase (EC [Lentimonas sp. CC19]CAA7069133.1 Choline-sulfatase (EC [Lentimonas sp. CC11]
MGKSMKRLMTLLSVGLLSFSAMSSIALAASKDPEQPNILFLLTDDQRWDDMAAMGNPIIQTPTMDRLAELGTLFTQATVSSPICMASRATCFSGQPERFHRVNFGGSKFTNTTWSQTYPQVFRDSGYFTGFIGKYGVFAQFDAAEKFDVWNGFHQQGSFTTKDGRHLTEVIAEQAIDFMEQSEAQPFCLSISFKAPHFEKNSLPPIEACKDLYKDIGAIPLRGSEFIKKEYVGNDSFVRDRYNMFFSDAEKRSETIKMRYRAITGVDMTIDKIMQKLDDLEIADNTVIVFMGDNGYSFGEHGLAEKYWMHEESVRVPMIVYDPRIPAEQRIQQSDALVSNIDVAPTLLAAAGLEVPEIMTGMDIAPLLTSEDVAWRETVFSENLFTLRGGPLCDSARTPKWKYVEYFDNPEITPELYDLEKDPLEMNNIFSNPEYQSVVEKMRDALIAHRKYYSADESGWKKGNAVSAQKKKAGKKKK